MKEIKNMKSDEILLKNFEKEIKTKEFMFKFEGFFIIREWMLNIPILKKWTTIVIFAIIYSFIQKSNSYFFDIEYLQKISKISRATIYRELKELTNKHLLISFLNQKSGRNEYAINWNSVEKYF